MTDSGTSSIFGEDESDIEYISRDQLRQKFNDAGIWAAAEAGALSQKITADDLAPPRSGEPYGTRSQIVTISKDGELVGVVHLYRRPNGEVGASGLPDPKILIEGGITYAPWDYPEDDDYRPR